MTRGAMGSSAPFVGPSGGSREQGRSALPYGPLRVCLVGLRLGHWENAAVERLEYLLHFGEDLYEIIPRGDYGRCEI